MREMGAKKGGRVSPGRDDYATLRGDVATPSTPAAFGKLMGEEPEDGPRHCPVESGTSYKLTTPAPLPIVEVLAAIRA